MSDGICLTHKQRADLLAVLGWFSPPIERVDVFGSRARGDARPGSDIDLVLAGPLDIDTISLIASALEDSYLSIAADVTAYSVLKQDVFAQQVVRYAKPLFNSADLAAAPPFCPVDGLREWYRPVAA